MVAKTKTAKKKTAKTAKKTALVVAPEHPELAVPIIAAHRRAQECLGGYLLAAVEAGKAMVAAQKAVGWGGWRKWCETYLSEVSSRTRERYMAYAKYEHKAKNLKAPSLAELGITTMVAADKFLARKPRTAEEAPARKPRKAGKAKPKAPSAAPKPKSLDERLLHLRRDGAISLIAEEPVDLGPLPEKARVVRATARDVWVRVTATTGVLVLPPE